MLDFINFLRSNLLFNEAVGCGPAWWNLVFSAETTHLVKGWFGGKSSDALLSTDCCHRPPPVREPSYVEWMHDLERNDGCNPLFHPFLSCELEIVVPSSHSKSAPGQDLVWTECSFACWLWCVQMMKICCSCNDWWVIPTWKVLV